MITVMQAPVHPESLFSQVPLNEVQRHIVETMARSPEMYSYDSMEQLKFELTLRYNTVGAAEALNFSGAGFANYDESRCNPEYWMLTPNGGFQLRAGMKSSDAIQDIYYRGPLYAFECSMAMVIVFYGAVLKSIGASNFDRMFGGLFIHDWHYDQDLGLTTYDQNEFLPGDVLYFNNPDFNPATPEWQGENVVYMGGDLYFGHGVGIIPKRQMIHFLNMQRRGGLFLRSAYLLRQATRPDYKYLSRFSIGFMNRLMRHEDEGHRLIKARVGYRTYMEM